MSSHKSVAFFGATGGSTAPCLAQCLRAGYTCVARTSSTSLQSDNKTNSSPIVVRDSSKLTTLLEASHSITPDLIASHLVIITGNVKDPIAVSKTLFPTHLNRSNAEGNNCVDIIVSGIGCYPVMKTGSWLPQQEDPSLCEDGVTTILNSLRSRPATVKPSLVVLSTTGISSYGRDIPLLMVPLYSLLHEAHKDKKAMEELALEAVEEESAPIGSCSVVRASLLTNGAARGVENVRWDVEKGAVASKGIGYWISRADVGGFVFEKLVQPFESGKGEQSGKIYSITY